MLIDLDTAGAHPSTGADGRLIVRFGIYLPGIRFPEGYRVQVRVIHEADQFTRWVEPVGFWLDWEGYAGLDLWSVTVDLVAGRAHFGRAGTYVYRFQVLREGADGTAPVTPEFADPFGRAAARGGLSAFTVGIDEAVTGSWHDDGFRVPEVDDMIVYELHVGEFNGTFDGVVEQLDHLTGLGVNVLEIMPVTDVREDVEWGYTPLGYFAPDERFGGPAALRRMVDRCHAAEVAVVLDAVYAHAHPDFAYNLVYERTGLPNPMMGPFAGEFFGSSRPGFDHTKSFTREFVHAVNRFWLTEYHVDGFRYDYVPGIWDGPTGRGYADLVYRTYELSRDVARFPRFDSGDGRSLVVQCAEHLPDPRGVLATTYSNVCWQNELFDLARAHARGEAVLGELARHLDPELVGYPATYRNPATGDVVPVAPFQYFESHDHGRFVAEFGLERFSDLVWSPFGDRSQWYRTQPYVIALYTAKGVPMLWQGQEMAENWTLPGGTDPRRTLFSRPVHWEYFYDGPGRALVRLHRRLGVLRHEHRALRSRGDFFYVDDERHRRDGVVVFHRQATDESLVVTLNFSDSAREVWLCWPQAGSWIEKIDEVSKVQVDADRQWLPVSVASHYGTIHVLEMP